MCSTSRQDGEKRSEPKSNFNLSVSCIFWPMDVVVSFSPACVDRFCHLSVVVLDQSPDCFCV